MRLAFPVLCIWGWLTFYRDVRPDLRIFGIDVEPLFETGLGVRLYCVDGALGFANTAIDAFVRVDDEHVLALVEAVDRTYLNAVHVFTFDTAFIDDVGQLRFLPTAARPKAISESWNPYAVNGLR